MKDLDYLEELINTNADTVINEVKAMIKTKDDEIKELNEKIEDLQFELDEFEYSENSSISIDSAEDCRRSVFFAQEELKEIQSGQTTLEDKIRDLSLRYRRFI
jgi:cell division septum initiation protein DivIVA